MENTNVYSVSDISLDNVVSVRFYGVRNGLLIDLLSATGKNLNPIFDQDIYDECFDGKCASEKDLKVIHDQIWSDCSYDILVIPYKLICHIFDEKYKDENVADDYFRGVNYRKNLLFT